MLCKICNQDFQETTFTDHMFDNGSLNKTHELTSEQYANVIWDRKELCPYCGGTVAHHTFNYGGDVGWEIVCNQCGFLFDED